MKKSYTMSLVIGASLLIAALAFFVFENRKADIVIYDGNWNSLWLNNQIAGYIIEHGYGYNVIYHGTTEKEATEGLAKGTIDLQLESWDVANVIVRKEYTRMLEKGDVFNLGVTFSNAGNYLIIPAWVAKQYNIRTVEDMKKHWRVFQNPDNPTKGIFYNGVDGWSITKLNEILLRGYGLDKFYDSVKFGHAESELKAFVKAQEEKKPVFGYYWQPSYLMGKYKWHILEEPTHDKAIWDALNKAYHEGKPIQKACAQPPENVVKYGSRGVVEDASEVADMVRKMDVGLNALHDTLIWGQDNNVKTDWSKPAIYYLKTYEDRWKNWVTAEAYTKIKISLAREQ